MLEDALEHIKKYDFKEAADVLVYLMGYFDKADDNNLSEIFKKIYDLL